MKRKCKFFGYVKVELLPQLPRRWVWSVRMDAGDIVTFTSDAPYASAEDAWSAGRRVLNALEEGTLIHKHPALEEVD